MAPKTKRSSKTTASLGFEAKLWLTADKLRNNMDAAEYKHVVLGLIFLKYISDTFEEHRAKLVKGNGEKSHRSVDLLDRAYAHFVTRFASAQRKNGGRFYTSSCVVRCLVEMLAPYMGRSYDPACGSGGIFVQSEKFVESHGGKLGDISIYGHESNATTRRLAVMNLAWRGRAHQSHERRGRTSACHARDREGRSRYPVPRVRRRPVVQQGTPIRRAVHRLDRALLESLGRS